MSTLSTKGQGQARGSPNGTRAHTEGATPPSVLQGILADHMAHVPRPPCSSHSTAWAESRSPAGGPVLESTGGEQWAGAPHPQGEAQVPSASSKGPSSQGPTGAEKMLRAELFWAGWAQSSSERQLPSVALYDCPWAAERLGLLCVSGPLAWDPDILEPTIPRRQRGHCTMPTLCSPRPPRCLQMRTWDPDWAHHLEKANGTERNARLEVATRGSHKFQNVPGGKYMAPKENMVPKPSHCHK